MVSSSVCERVLSRALSRGGTFAEIFIEDSRNFSMFLRDGRIENAALSRPYGAGVASTTVCAPFTSTPAT